MRYRDAGCFMAGAMLTYMGQALMQVSALDSMQEEDDRFLMASRQARAEGDQTCSEVEAGVEAVVRRMLAQAATSGEAKISGGADCLGHLEPSLARAVNAHFALATSTTPSGALGSFPSAKAAPAKELPRANSQQASTAQCAHHPPPSDVMPEMVLQPLDDFNGAIKVPADVKPAAWGVPMATATVSVNNKTLEVVDIVDGYNFLFEGLHMFSMLSWRGVAVQQDPIDAFAIEDMLWREQPDLLIELGTNTGGSALFYAQVMQDYNPDSLVFTVDPHPPSVNWDKNAESLCPHCRDVSCHPLWNSGAIEFKQGVSWEPKVVDRVEQIVQGRTKVMVMQDANHLHASVINDLEIYDKFVTVGSYFLVQDTKLTRMRPRYKTLEAVHEFLDGQGKGRYAIDKRYEYQLFSHHHNGFLRKMKQ
mmetsp:Transcript_36937/g.84472  ORF Transcript_36937/g.84472 Transcript_36937/m.84472 type:complete len:420 (-) Transcript_36937:104-1363(-)